MKLRLKPSIPLEIESVREGSWLATLIYDGGRKELVLDLDAEGLALIKALAGDGIAADDERLAPLKERHMLIEPECMALIESRPLTQRQSLFLCDLARDFSELQGALDNIEHARIAIVGLGGIGANMFDALLRMGFIRFIVVDQDRVAPSNLNRQRIYTSADVGALKVEAAADYARRVNPQAEVRILCDTVANLPASLLDGSIVINCADRPSIQHTSEALVSANPAMVALLLGGGYFCETSFAGPLLVPGEWGLLSGIGEDRERRIAHQSAVGGNNFSSAVLPASIGALEVLRFVTGLGDLNLRRAMMIFDWRDLGVKLVDLE